MSETKNMTPESFAKFLDSLKVTKEGPEEMHGWKFDEPLQPFDITMFELRDGEGISRNAVEYLVERIRRADAKNKPVTKEELRQTFEATYSVRYSAAEVQEHPRIRDNAQVFKERKAAMWDGFILAANCFGKLREGKDGT